MEDDILTIEEVAKYLRVSERTVYDWAQKGEIPSGKIGTVWRFKKSEIESALKNGIKAKGETFNNDRWSKIFDGFSIAEIKAQSDEWLDEAKKEFNAGVHKTQAQFEKETKDINVDNYKL